jgi:hypothetical protein
LCQTISGCTTWPVSTLDIPQDNNVPDSFEPSASGARVFTMRNGTLTGATTPAVVSGDYTGNSETVITVTFNVDPDVAQNCDTTGAVTTCSVALWFGAHVAAQANWGLGLGAGSISGSPYHVSLDALDGAAIGERDNQMQANVVDVIPNGTIVIVKQSLPPNPEDFSFNLTNNSTISQNFSLDDDGDPTLPNSQTFSVPPGIWTATELLPPGNWSLTQLVCVDPSANTSVNLAARTATIDLASFETVTCTFTSENPTAVTLSQGTARLIDGSMVVEWTTVQEIDLIGFNVYRSGALTGTRTRLNSSVIPATGGFFGATYQFVDPTAGPGAQYYWVEPVEANGNGELFGPVTNILNLYLPLAVR